MITWDLYLTYIREVKHVKCDRHNTNVYSSRFNTLAHYFDQKPFNRYTCDQFLASLSGKSNSTVNNYLKIVKNVCSALRYYQMEDETVIRRIEEIKYLPKKNLKQIDILTTHEIKAIANLRVPYKKSRIEINRRWRALIMTLGLGIRIGELIELQWKDYHEDYIVVGEEGKTRQAYRKIFVPHKLEHLINELHHYPHEYIFGSQHGKVYRETVNEELRMRAKILGIHKYIHNHTIRHSVIVNLLENGASIQDVMYTVGHKDPRVTMEYAHLGLKQTKATIERSDLFKSNTIERTKELLQSKIEKVYDKDILRAIDTLLK